MQLNRTLVTMALIAIGAIAVPITNDKSIGNIGNFQPAVEKGYGGSPQRRGDNPPTKTTGYEALQKPEDYVIPQVNHKQGKGDDKGNGHGSIPKPEANPGRQPDPVPEPEPQEYDQQPISTKGQGEANEKAPKPQPESQLQPEPQSKPQPELQSNPQPEPQSNPQPEPQSQPQPEPQSKPQTQPEGEHDKQPTSDEGSYGYQKGQNEKPHGEDDNNDDNDTFYPGYNGWGFLNGGYDKRPAAYQGYEGFSKRGGVDSLLDDDLFREDKENKKPADGKDQDGYQKGQEGKKPVAADQGYEGIGGIGF